MRLQRVQQAHDEVAHRDILSFNLHKRLKHMVLHFYKYAGNIEVARGSSDVVMLSRVLIDALIICMASANALNLSLDRDLDSQGDLDVIARQQAQKLAHDPFSEAISQLVLIGGQMAKTVESLDHMEGGNPRAEMSLLVPRMTAAVLGLLGRAGIHDIEDLVLRRLTAVEQRSIFTSPKP